MARNNVLRLDQVGKIKTLLSEARRTTGNDPVGVTDRFV
jgi:hypothetical protein